MKKKEQEAPIEPKKKPKKKIIRYVLLAIVIMVVLYIFRDQAQSGGEQLIDDGGIELLAVSDGGYTIEQNDIDFIVKDSKGVTVKTIEAPLGSLFDMEGSHFVLYHTESGAIEVYNEMGEALWDTAMVRELQWVRFISDTTFATSVRQGSDQYFNVFTVEGQGLEREMGVEYPNGLDIKQNNHSTIKEYALQQLDNQEIQQNKIEIYENGIVVGHIIIQELILDYGYFDDDTVIVLTKESVIAFNKAGSNLWQKDLEGAVLYSDFSGSYPVIVCRNEDNNWIQNLFGGPYALQVLGVDGTTILEDSLRGTVKDTSLEADLLTILFDDALWQMPLVEDGQITSTSAAMGSVISSSGRYLSQRIGGLTTATDMTAPKSN